MAPQPDPGRWRRLETLFHQAAELDAEARTRFLEDACGADADMRRDVESLLASADKTLGALREPVWKAIDDAGMLAVPERIGAYRLIRVLGEGGMGKVYLAARADDQFQHQVAIKIMHAGFGLSPAMLLRFRSERQILANLDHPNIARLLDGGMTPEGLPYLVMEYVDGVAIDHYSRARELEIDARLQLFRTVCTAVEYAHQNLVVHRDIKPANILVTAQGVPKLLDFGIARLLDPTLDAGGAAPTRTTERMMTPEYASPEQILGEPVTTATDVYELGVLLYELLAGKRPFHIESKSPLEIARVVCEQTPEPPSAVAAPAQARKIRGDLDKIVMMAVRKEPVRRYASVARMAADVQAFLEGFPLQARTDSWAYRADRFVRRHRLTVILATVLVLALIGFSIGMGVLARRAQRDQEIARKEAEFLAGMFQAATPEAARGHTVTARELLDQGARRVDRELASQPEVRASMLDNIAGAYRSLGLYDEAVGIAKRSYDLKTGLYGGESAKVAGALETLAELYRDKADYKQAEPLLGRLVALRRKSAGAGRVPLARALAFHGECLYQDEKDRQAEPILREALAIYRQNGPNQGADARNYLALLLERKGEYPEARQLLQEAVDIERRVDGADSPEYAIALHNLGSALIDVGDLPGAEAKLREGLAIRRKVLDRDHPFLVYSLNNVGYVLLEKGEPQDAAPYLREALDICLRRYGVVHPRTAGARNTWARLLEARGEYDSAEQEFRAALAVFEKLGGPVNWGAASVLNNLGTLEFDRRRYAAAESLARQSLDMRRKLGGEGTPAVALALSDLGEDRLFQKDARGAEPLLREALEIRQRKYTPGHPQVIGAAVRLGEAVLAEGEPQRAERILRDAWQSARTAPFPLVAWQTAEAEAALGECLRKLGRVAEGEKLVRDSQAGLRKHPRPVFRSPGSWPF